MKCPKCDKDGHIVLLGDGKSHFYCGQCHTYFTKWDLKYRESHKASVL